MASKYYFIKLIFVPSVGILTSLLIPLFKSLKYIENNMAVKLTPVKEKL